VAAPTDGPFDSFHETDSTFSSGVDKGKRLTAFRPGVVVDQSYRLNKVIGQGAMGVVFSCTHLVLQKDYALKLLLDSDLSSESWSRFQIEAKALARLNHRGIVGIHNMGVHHSRAQGGDIECDTPYYVMDLLSGENLDDLLRKSGPLTLRQALDYFIQVADALHFAHAQGIVHRDIKPSNLMLLRDKNEQISQIKVVDFGIARVNRSGHGSQSQTATGLVFGTPFYMSPEQCRGERVDHRADIYSFGCTLFEALTGEPPFKGKNAFQTFMMHQGDDVPSLESRRAEGASAEEFPDGLEAVVAKTLQKNAADRYQSMEQLKHDLERVKQGKDVTSRGLRSTIAPTQELFSSGQRDLTSSGWQARAGESKFEDDNDYEEDGDSVAGEEGLFNRPLVWVGLVALLTAAVVGTLTIVVWQPTKLAKVDSRIEGLSSLLGDGLSAPYVLKEVGASDAEKEYFRKFDWETELKCEEVFENKAEAFIKRTAPLGTSANMFKKGDVFYFPSDVYLGGIQFNNGPIQHTSGAMPIPPIASGVGRQEPEVHYYLGALTKDYPEILDRFGPDDLTGIDMKIDDPRSAIERLKKWHKLKDLSFFNAMTKSLPTFEDKIENTLLHNDMLASVDKFQNLRSLGLGGKELSGSAIAKMTLLRRVKTLKIKGIRDANSLIAALPALDNIEELWLMSLKLEDNELEPLTRMKNLKSLRITRSHLSPASLAYFKRMPALSRLRLDRSWTDAEKLEFAKVIPGYEFEPVFDPHYWHLGPGETHLGEVRK
jgi:serine/threonine protein kinase